MIQPTRINAITNTDNCKKSPVQKNTHNNEMVSAEANTNCASESKTKDSFVKTSDFTSLEQITYSKPKADYTNEVNTLLEQHARQIEEFKDKILSMISKQNERSNAKILELDLTVSNKEIQAAKEAISEDGEWGVNAVATRIMDMAYSLSGGDTSKLDLLKNAVIDGFKAAGFDPENRENSKMPAITGQTYDEIMKRFDDWKNGTNTSTDSEE